MSRRAHRALFLGLAALAGGCCCWGPPRPPPQPPPEVSEPRHPVSIANRLELLLEDSPLRDSSRPQRVVVDPAGDWQDPVVASSG